MTVMDNDTIKSILARRSYKAFDSRPFSEDILETIIEAGKYAPTGRNRQAWHFTVVKSEDGKKMYKEALTDFMINGGGPKVAPPPVPPNIIVKPEPEFRGAPVLILVSGPASDDLVRIDCALAMGNMFIAAASFGVMSGWTHTTVRDLFPDPAVKKKFKIPDGNDVYAAAFFGYPLGEPKDRGPRKEGTVTVV
ncbi:MAG: nitroreductase family protein [Deltaproteobacteria bacterium]|nr:nitroreductase family protein [Deltaproteobacteria bacterium]